MRAAIAGGALAILAVFGASQVHAQKECAKLGEASYQYGVCYVHFHGAWVPDWTLR